MKRALAVAALGLLMGCSEAPADPSSGEDISDYPGQELGGETYDAFDQRRDSYEGARGEFAGDGCTEDCSGHEAGAQWAAEHGIDDPDDCGGKSWSFEEGCRAYAEDQSSVELSDNTDAYE